MSSPLKPGQLSFGTKRTDSPAEVWGLTGGIASGKSTVAKIFAELGIPVIDADGIARELSAPGGAAFQVILQRFGTADRSRLREIVFSDPSARQDLEAILHPLIQAETLKRTQALAAKSKSEKQIVIYEAALLVETGRAGSFAGLIVVDAPRELRKARLIARSQLTEEIAEKILAAQISDDARRKAATVILDNSGDAEALRSQVLQLATQKGWAHLPGTSHHS